MRCPKCGKEIEDRDVCPACKHRIEEEESKISTMTKDFTKKKHLIIEFVLSLIIVVLLGASIGINEQKVNFEKQYYDLQTKLDNTSKSLQIQLKEKDSKITDNEKKIVELQQEEKQNEINNNIKSLEMEKQKLEDEKRALEEEKQKLNLQIEDLKKTSSAVSQNKNTATKTSTSPAYQVSTQNTNSTIVYVTKTGNKYHKSSCSYLSRSKIEMTLTNAQNSGYTPCSRCY